MNRMTEAYCSSCKSAKSFDKFHAHILVGEKYLPFCKTCCSSKMREYIKATGNSGAALWCLLAELGIPFLKEVWTRTEKIVNESTGQGRKPDLFLTYLRVFNEIGFVAHGFWESDIMLDDFIDIGEKKSQREKQLAEKKRQELLAEQEKREYLKEQQKIWGKYEEDEYIFLNDTFDDYTKDLLEMDTNLIRRYRDLAKAELRKRKADESGDIGEITKAQDSLNKQLALLGLNDFKKKNDEDERKLFIDRIAWMIEETEPAEEEDQEKYRDIAGYEKIYDSWMRSMRNILTGSRDYPDIPPEEG